MDLLIWIGAAISAIGLCGILWSLLTVVRAKRAGLSDDAMRAQLAKVLPVNLGAMLLSILGLMAVVVGVILT